MLNKIKAFWEANTNEIITSVMKTNKEIAQNEKSVDKRDSSKRNGRNILPIIIAIIYCVVGSIMLWGLGQEDSLAVAPQNIIIGLELIVLGLYVLLNVGLFMVEYKEWKNKRVLRSVKILLIILLLPYHIVIKEITSFLKDTKQVHVAYFFPYFLLSLFIVMITGAFMIEFIAKMGINEAYNQVAGFILVLILIKEFFLCVKLCAWFATKSVIKSVQKGNLKQNSKVNLRKTLKGEMFAKERKEKFENEWAVIKAELEYTEIYFYIIITVLVLWIPQESGSLGELLTYQFLGITTIAALAREVRAKRE